MPFIIHCPTCRNPLTAGESEMPYVVACPSCRMPLTVPASSTVPTPVAEEPFALSSDETSYRSRRRRRSSIGMTLLLSGLGLWLLSAVVLIIGYAGAFRAAEVGNRDGVIPFVIPVYGGWCIAFFGTAFFFMGLLAIVIQAGVRDAQD